MTRSKTDYLYVPYNPEHYLPYNPEPFLQSADDWPSWDWEFGHRAYSLRDHVFGNEPAVAKVFYPKPSDYPITNEAKKRVKKARLELEALDNDNGEDIFPVTKRIKAENGSIIRAETSHRPRQDILDDLFVSPQDLTPHGKDLLGTDLSLFEIRYMIWEDFDKDNTELRNWVRGSVCNHYAITALKPEWDTRTWYQKLKEVVDYRGPGRKALRRMAWDNLRHKMGYPPHLNEALWEEMTRNDSDGE